MTHHCVFSDSRRPAGSVWSWGGNNAFGQLGRAVASPSQPTIAFDHVTSARPGVLPTGGDVIAVSAGARFGAVVRADGVIETFGSGAHGKLGHRGVDW